MYTDTTIQLLFNAATFCLFLVTCHGSTNSDLHVTHQRLDECRDKTGTNFILSILNNVTPSDCAVTCEETFQCLLFFYSTNTRSCSLHSLRLSDIEMVPETNTYCVVADDVKESWVVTVAGVHSRGLTIPLVRVKDKGGQTVTFRESRGVLLPPDFQEGILDDVPKLKMRENDILIANWMRSGTHWMWEMTHMLVNNNTETIPKFKEEEMIEFQPAEVLDELPSPRVFNTHLRLRSLPEALTTERHRVIYLVRNPRDAMVSWYRMTLQHSPFEYKGKWHNWLPVQLEGKFDYGSWIDHVRDWEKVFETHPNLDVHFWHYEDMITNPLEELRKVSEFLGTNTDESFLEAVVYKCHIDRMREHKAKYGMTEDGVLHYKKGKIGTWKELFTVEQYEYFEKIYREKMAGSRFEERYKGIVEVL